MFLEDLHPLDAELTDFLLVPVSKSWLDVIGKRREGPGTRFSETH
jgi:hypothetical protein